MKSLKYFLFVYITILVILNSTAFAEALPNYKLIDLGLLETDNSYANAINDQGQVLGRFEDRGQWHTFLWDAKDGLKIIDLPNIISNPYSGEILLKLNNHGQIAGTYLRGNEHRTFLWDPITGFFDIGSGFLKKLNDNGLILYYELKSNEDAYSIQLWDHGIVTNLTDIFKEQFPDFKRIECVTLNNKNEVAVTAVKKNNQNQIFKSFIFSSNQFLELLPGYNQTSSVIIKDFDDYGNMIVETYDSSSSYKSYFMNPDAPFQAEIGFSYSTIIRNKRPLVVWCIPSTLRCRFDGIFYFRFGAEISNLIKDKGIFRRIETDYIRDQNMHGQVVGQGQTIYPDQIHAFLAVPVE